jgi:hypothetical protein
VIPKHGFACLLLLSAFSLATPVFAMQTVSVNDTAISGMEVKLFARAYNAEPDESRIKRLESFVFGAATSDGSVKERLDRLSSCVRVKNSELGNVPYLPRKRYNYAPPDPATVSDYPRVTQLEQVLFGQAYVNDSISKRLSRLEMREFGKVSSSADLAVRTDALAAIATPEQSSQPRSRYVSYKPSARTAGDYHNNMFGLFRTTPDQRTMAQQPGTVVDQIEFLENATFGKTRPNRTLQKRVHALEEKYYGSPKTEEKDLSTRVAELLALVNGGGSRSILNRGV